MAVIFLHSSFRTASTYLWSCFRKAPRTVAYYEIFHEVLSTVTLASISTFKPDGWYSKHAAGAPYFLEYVPLLREGGGVERFDPSMSYEQFIPDGGCSGNVSDMEAYYVRSLIDHAEHRGKIPVLTATRSLGRATGLRRAFPGLHVLVYRNLFQQWCSFTEQAFRGNPYFMARIAAIMQLHQSDPILQRIHKLFPVKEEASAEDLNTFYSFTFLHLYLYTQAAGAMDLIIDVNRLEADLPYRAQVESRIAAEDVILDLSNTRNTIAYSLCQIGSAADFSEKISVVGNMIVDRAPDNVGRAFGIKVMADMMEERARHDFQASALRSVLFGPTGFRAERDAVRLERDRVIEKRDEWSAAHAAVLAEASALKAERDGLVSERDAMSAAYAAALAEASALKAEQGGLASERDAMSAAHAIVLAEAGALKAERDGLASERDAMSAAHATVLAEAGALKAERDGLASERDAMSAAHAAVLAEAGALKAERDGLTAQCETLAEWAQADRKAVLASLSWRLTRPLRRFGIGRADRPSRQI